MHPRQPKTPNPRKNTGFILEKKNHHHCLSTQRRSINTQKNFKKKKKKKSKTKSIFNLIFISLRIVLILKHKGIGGSPHKHALNTHNPSLSFFCLAFFHMSFWFTKISLNKTVQLAVATTLFQQFIYQQKKKKKKKIIVEHTLGWLQLIQPSFQEKNNFLVCCVFFLTI